MTGTTSAENEWPVARFRPNVRSSSSVETATSEAPRFERHCIEEFEWLARNNPAELVRLVVSEVARDSVLLSHAVEAMSLSHDPTLILPALMRVLAHDRPFVRESAILGIAPFLSGSLQARDRVREIAQFDTSPGVREAAADALALL